MAIRNCFKAGIGFQGLFHDLSKYTPTEFIQGAKFYSGEHSPIRDERITIGYSVAWMHHKGRNKHHYEYWTDTDPVTRKMVPVAMPDNYVKEMFCDRLAAPKVYNGKNYAPEKPMEYLQRESKSWSIHPDTEAKIRFLLQMLIDKGEKETFRYLRNNDTIEVPESK